MLLVTLGGLAIFLFGLSSTSSALEEIGGNTFRRILIMATQNRFKALLAGTLASGLSQSGTAMAVTVIGLVGANLLAFREALALSLGAKIGGTIAIQLAAFQIYDYALPIIAIGFFGSLWRPGKQIGKIIFGIGFLFLGLDLMIQSLATVRNDEIFNILVGAAGQNSFVLVVIGIILAAIVHSSNATVAIALGLFATEVIALPSAMALMIGGNIGSTILPFVASAGAGITAKRVAMAHIILKAVFGLAAVLILPQLSVLVAALGGSAERQLANSHTLFNLTVGLSSLFLLPVMQPMVGYFFPDQPDKLAPKYLPTDSVPLPEGLQQARRELSRIGDQIENMMSATLKVFNNDAVNKAEIAFREEKVDRLTEAVVLFLARYPERAWSDEQLRILRSANEMEHLGDLIRRLIRQDDKLRVRGFSLSDEGKAELFSACQQVHGRMQTAFLAMATRDIQLSDQVCSTHCNLKTSLDELRGKHLQRLRSGWRESRSSSAVHLDILMILEGIDRSVITILELMCSSQTKVEPSTTL